MISRRAYPVADADAHPRAANSDGRVCGRNQDSDKLCPGSHGNSQLDGAQNGD